VFYTLFEAQPPHLLLKGHPLDGTARAAERRMSMDGSGCKNCPAYQKCTAQYRSSRCAHNRATYGVESDPFTNADRIRAMTDEELAGWIARTQIGAIKDAMTILRLPYAECDEIVEIGKTEALEWLHAPAEGE
jgi:hypothetical protein